MPMDAQSPTDEVKDKIFALDQRMRTLAWDAEHNQINPAKKVQYEKMKGEREQLTKQLQTLA